MKTQRDHDRDQMRRRKRHQRRAKHGAPHPSHYTECKPIQSNFGEQHVKNS